ncbi:MAG TPA: hypothetical protein VND19_02890 [Acetobacteraceae bacterium]|nr:hypothetical protein [Acetobacteraceae bacterium]
MELNEWLVLVLLTLVAIGGLLFSAGSAGGSASDIGLLVAVAAVAGAFMRIKQHFDRIDAGRH